MSMKVAKKLVCVQLKGKKVFSFPLYFSLGQQYMKTNGISNLFSIYSMFSTRYLWNLTFFMIRKAGSNTAYVSCHEVIWFIPSPCHYV